MYVLDNILKNSTLDSNDKKCRDTNHVRVKTAASLLSSVVEIACEYAPDLDLTRLVNYLHLYEIYLRAMQCPGSELSKACASIPEHLDSVITQKLAATDLVSFERFVRDHQLLELAAAEASLESGDRVATPPPLVISANHALPTRTA